MLYTASQTGSNAKRYRQRFSVRCAYMQCTSPRSSLCPPRGASLRYTPHVTTAFIAFQMAGAALAPSELLPDSTVSQCRGTGLQSHCRIVGWVGNQSVAKRPANGLLQPTRSNVLQHTSYPPSLKGVTTNGNGPAPAYA
jgi:hypothetical protein